VVGTETVLDPPVWVVQGVVFGFAIVGSVVSVFSSVTRRVLARHPNGVLDAAEAELANTSVTKHAPSNAVSRRAFAESI
jgi:hypothetical protein